MERIKNESERKEVKRRLIVSETHEKEKTNSILHFARTILWGLIILIAIYVHVWVIEVGMGTAAIFTALYAAAGGFFERFVLDINEKYADRKEKEKLRRMLDEYDRAKEASERNVDKKF